MIGLCSKASDWGRNVGKSKYPKNIWCHLWMLPIWKVWYWQGVSGSELMKLGRLKLPLSKIRYEFSAGVLTTCIFPYSCNLSSTCFLTRRISVSDPWVRAFSTNSQLVYKSARLPSSSSFCLARVACLHLEMCPSRLS